MQGSSAKRPVQSRPILPKRTVQHNEANFGPQTAITDPSPGSSLLDLDLDLGYIVNSNVSDQNNDPILALDDILPPQTLGRVEEVLDDGNFLISDTTATIGAPSSGSRNHINELTRMALSPFPFISSRTSRDTSSTSDRFIITAGEQQLDLRDVIAAGLEVLTKCRSPLDPYSNFIQFTHTRIVSACLHNAQVLGLLIQDIASPLSMPCSPFYRPITAADDPKEILASMTKPSTPVHLQPTMPQVLYPHHAFFDTIPIPILRARAITLSAIQPDLFNPLELKKDIVSGGLICWTSGVNHSRGYIKGQPWDMRSWEIAPWFLKKWRMLLDGEDGDAWKQSLWWQRARAGGDGGDDISYSNTLNYSDCCRSYLSDE